MKAYIAIFLSMFTVLTMRAQSDSLGLPGDGLDLCGALELFKTSKSPDAFEKSLNLKDSKINNLDLNKDGKVDYLRVVDMSKGDAHALVIRAVVNKNESQDVAVIEIEKKGEKNAQLQIVGDEELYGKNYIIEPKTEKAATEGKWQGFAPQIIIVNVWYWPCVSYMWYPDYVIWVSPWYWGYYPAWWYPWGPMPYYMYYHHVHYYHDYYYWTDDYRMEDAHSVYQPRRVASTTVHNQNGPAREKYAQKQKSAPRNNSGQNPVPGKRPDATKDKPVPQKETPRETPKENVPPTPQQSRDVPPAPVPPRQKDNVTPRPQGQPDIKAPPRQTPPRQTPRPPRSAPQPRPRPR